MNFQFLDKYSGYAHWALRIAIGSVFLYHGLGKFGNLSGGAAMMGFPVIVWTLLAVVESAGGLLVLLGGFLPDWATRLGALLVIPPMLGAIAMVHWGQWSFMPSDTHPAGGIEFQVTLVLLAVYLVLKGNGINQAPTPAA